MIYRLGQIFSTSFNVSSYFLKDGYTIFSIFKWPVSDPGKYWIGELYSLPNIRVEFYNYTHVGINWIDEYAQRLKHLFNK